jgi:four helix bundle protein
MNKLDFADDFKHRTKSFSLRVLNLYKNLPKTPDAQIIGTQLFRCASSVAAYYRAVCRARSDAEFLSKLSIVVEEADETVYWLEMLMDGGIVKKIVWVNFFRRQMRSYQLSPNQGKRQKRINNSANQKLNK